MPTYKREERLRSRKLIRDLFKSGRSFVVFPFRVIAMKDENPGRFPASLAVSVPKRNLKKASSRNRVRRLVKEAYRKHKDEFYRSLEKDGIRKAVMIVFQGKEPVTLKETEDKIILILNRLTSIESSEGNGKN